MLGAADGVVKQRGASRKDGGERSENPLRGLGDPVISDRCQTKLARKRWASIATSAGWMRGEERSGGRCAGLLRSLNRRSVPLICGRAEGRRGFFGSGEGEVGLRA